MGKEYVENTITALLNQIDNRVDEEANNIVTSTAVSGFILHRYVNLHIDIYQVVPLRAASYTATPEKFSNAKCGLINIQNEDNECFKWCMLYHQSAKNKNDHRVSALKKVKNKYDFTGITFPTSIDDICKFENLNKVCIYIYEISEKCDVDENNEEAITHEIIRLKSGNSTYIKNDII